MCKCVNVEVGSYDNQVQVYNPYHIKRPYIWIDKCMVEEIYKLWGLGIETTGCCCGHNEQEGYIGVLDKYVRIMRKMGYVNKFNESRPQDQSTFFPRLKHAKPFKNPKDFDEIDKLQTGIQLSMFDENKGV